MNSMQKTLDTIIAEKQKLLKIDYFYNLLLLIVYINDVSNKLNKNLAVISLSSYMKANSFITWLKMYIPISNLTLK